MGESCLDHREPEDDCEGCDCAQFAGDFYEWKYDRAVLARWEETREYIPSLLLQRVAGRFPELEGLCWLLPEDRRWYLGMPPPPPDRPLTAEEHVHAMRHARYEWPEEYIRGSFYPHLPDWAWAALAS